MAKELADVFAENLKVKVFLFRNEVGLAIAQQGATMSSIAWSGILMLAPKNRFSINGTRMSLTSQLAMIVSKMRDVTINHSSVPEPFKESNEQYLK
jgi:hypothetical protein